MDVLCDGEQVKVGVVDGEVDAEEPGRAVDPDQLFQLLKNGGSLVLQGVEHLKYFQLERNAKNMSPGKRRWC